jgi:hypothetical protein
MTSTVNVFIENENKPANIPSYESFDLRPTPAVTPPRSLDKSSDSEVSDIWVKFGSDITMGEAKTQCFVAQYLGSNDIAAVRAPRVYLAFMWGSFGFIVSEVHRWADMR